MSLPLFAKRGGSEMFRFGKTTCLCQRKFWFLPLFVESCCPKRSNHSYPQKLRKVSLRPNFDLAKQLRHRIHVQSTFSQSIQICSILEPTKTVNQIRFVL